MPLLLYSGAAAKAVDGMKICKVRVRIPVALPPFFGDYIMTTTQNGQDKYLAQMLEGFEKGLEGITNFIEENENQLQEARARREEMLDSIAELKDLLGISEEATD